MKLKLKLCIVMMAIPALLGLLASMVLAKTDIVPGGPWLTDNQHVSLERLSSYPELVMQLQQIEKTSKGLVQLEVIGTSNQGRDIYLAKAGNPQNPAVMIITQQHGNEPMTTEAALQLLKISLHRQQTGPGNPRQALRAGYRPG
ncbi:MAG TPA: M14 family zinc carboxypeptidase [Malonomonas sp.]